jgi:hypothetical protein
MRRWKNKWNQPSNKTKLDIQNIVNRHQQGALLEANETIRALEEQREEHRILLRAQEHTIRDLEAQIQKLKTGQAHKDENSNDVASSSTANKNSPEEELEELRQQLKEKDAEIENLKKMQQQQQTAPSSSEDKANGDNFGKMQKLESEITILKSTNESLTKKKKEQEEEIERLQNILREFEAFHSKQNNRSPSPARGAPEDDSDENGDEGDEIENKITPPQTPQREPQTTLNGNQLLMLVSSIPNSRIVAANQSRLETIVQGLELSSDEVQVLDGCCEKDDTASITLRNDLFRISGLHAKYPQLFLVSFSQNDISFVGDFETVLELHDTNKLADIIGLTPIGS